MNATVSSPQPPTADLNRVHKSITVAAPQDTAFRVFTAGMSGWWPLETHKIGQSAAREVVIEPKTGGRWFERGVDGVETSWGRVLTWEPPGRLVLTWEITHDWKADSRLVTEIEVRFVAEGAQRTRVELEHRNLDRYGDKRDEVRTVIGGQGGWSTLLELFGKRVSAV
jgi:uncharacterized protein YndB with AHSA1/START domain